MAWGQRDHGIQIELRYFRNFLGQPGNPKEQLAQRVEIGGCVSPESLQQFEPANAVQEIMGIAVGQRRNPEPNISQYLDVHAAESERDQCAEDGIVGDPNHRFNAASNQRLNDNAFAVLMMDASVRRGQRRQVLERRSNGAF